MLYGLGFYSLGSGREWEEREGNKRRKEPQSMARVGWGGKWEASRGTEDEGGQAEYSYPRCVPGKIAIGGVFQLGV